MDTQKKPTLCQICETSPSKYLCPRCGVPYCSLPCYKNETKHLQCSESFYRDCVVDSIKTEERSNPEGAQKMKEILQRFHEQYNEDGEDEVEELDSDDDEPLEKRLTGIDLNNADAVWENLTEEEKREFKKLVNNIDEAGDIIPQWTPWWCEEPEKKLVVELTEENAEAEGPVAPHSKLHKRQPDILNPIPLMHDLTKVKPNQHVVKGLINVVTAYTWTARLFNGDLFDSEKLVEIASSIVYLSSFLNKDGVFKTIEQAITEVPFNACQVPILSEGGTAIQANLNRDIWLIIRGPKSMQDPSSPTSTKSYLLSALTECYTVMCKAAKLIKNKNTAKPSGIEGSFSNSFPALPPVLSIDAALITKSKRKLMYLIAFANEFMDSMDIADSKSVDGIKVKF